MYPKEVVNQREMGELRRMENQGRIVAEPQMMMMVQVFEGMIQNQESAYTVERMNRTNEKVCEKSGFLRVKMQVCFYKFISWR